MHFDLQTWIAAGVGLHLLAAFARALFKAPRQQAQISAIETKVDVILGQLTESAKGTLK